VIWLGWRLGASQKMSLDAIIRYNLSGVAACAGRQRQNEARDILILTFLLIQERRYEHAGCAHRIHCR
jgi:hypothetical protein